LQSLGLSTILYSHRHTRHGLIVLKVLKTHDRSKILRDMEFMSQAAKRNDGK
jgi:hypothetical protein